MDANVQFHARLIGVELNHGHTLMREAERTRTIWSDGKGRVHGKS
jgi:hypothetical protein